MARPPTHHAERHSFVVLKFLGTTTQNLTARTTTILCFWGSLGGKILHWRNMPGEICGEICLAKFAGEIAGESCRQICGGICRQNFRQKRLVKTSLIFGEKPLQKISLATSTVLKTRHRPIPRTLPSLRLAQRKQAEVKGLCVFALCRLERQARGTKRGIEVGVLCSLCSHVSLVGLSLLHCIRWRPGLGPSNSRLQREHSVVARISKRGEGASLRMILVLHENQGENPFPIEIRGGICR